MKTAELRRLLRRPQKPGDPGSAFAWIQDGALRLEDVWGQASLELPSKLTRTSVFNGGSLAKQFVAACIHAHELRGKLSLDDRLRAHLPELPKAFEPVRLRHLLWHSSGIPCYTTLLWFSGLWQRTVMPRNEAVELIGKVRALQFKPGSRYLYGNSNYILLAEIVVRLGGSELGAQAQALLFKPLGMGQTHFRERLPRLIPGLVQGHRPVEEGWIVDRMPGAAAGAGRLMSSLADLERWALAWSRTPASLRPVFARMRQRGRLDDGSSMRYGSGLMWQDYRGLAMIRHDGYTASCRSEVCHFPELDASFTCLQNRTDLSPTWTIRQAVNALWPRRLATVSAWAPAGPDRPAGKAESPALARRRTGLYRQVDADRAFTLRVGPKGLRYQSFKTGFGLRSDRPGGYQGLESGAIHRLDFFPGGRVRVLSKGKPAWYRRARIRRADAGKDRALLGAWRQDETGGVLRFSRKGAKLFYSDAYWTGPVEAIEEGGYSLDLIRLSVRGRRMLMTHADAWAQRLAWKKLKEPARVV